MLIKTIMNSSEPSSEELAKMYLTSYFKCMEIASKKKSPSSNIIIHDCKVFYELFEEHIYKK